MYMTHVTQKTDTDENELVCWRYDHAQGHLVKGINFVTALCTVAAVSLPVSYRLVFKTESHTTSRANPNDAAR